MEPEPKKASEGEKQSGDLRARLRQLRPSVVTGGAASFPLLVLFGLNGVDEFDQQAFNVLLPEIRRAFALNLQSVLTLVSLAAVAILFLEVPIAHYADRAKRVRIAAFGAMGWAAFSVMTGLSPVRPLLWGIPVVLALARIGSGLGRAVSNPTHRSLLSDYYEVRVRPAVFAFWNAGNAVGIFLGPLIGGLVAHFWGWRAAFIVLAAPTVIFIALALRLREPVRGVQERKVMLASEEVAETEEEPASFGEAVRVLWQVRTSRRLWISLPVLGVPLFGTRPLMQLFYEEVLRMNVAERGLLAAVGEPFQFVGLFVGIPIATRLLRKNPSLIVYFISVVFAISTASTFLVVLSGSRIIAYLGAILFAAGSATLAPAISTLGSLIYPPRVRSLGFTLGGLFYLPALILAPIVGLFADVYGLRPTLLVFIPLQLIGIAMIGSCAQYVAPDVHQVRTSTLAMADVRAARLRGELKLLLIRDLDVKYGQTQVLFGVNLEVADGELLVLLGTNGAGKSTLLKTVSGSVAPYAGAIILDGTEVTLRPAHETAAAGITMAPGGKGVFPTLTVEEHFSLASWVVRNDPDHVRETMRRIIGYFPILEARWNDKAGNLSGGEQQMLIIGQALLAKPKLLMIDELSLGLAPVVVGNLLDVLREINDAGTTIILVEQSVNVALTIAKRVVFMEKGEVRFDGPIDDLLDKPDVLRSVFLEGAASTFASESAEVRRPTKASSAKITASRPRSVEKEDGDSSQDAPILAVNDLSVRFGGIRAVNGVSVSVGPGEIVGFIGPNGAGKTTVFDLISGFVVPESGQVALGGVDITNATPAKRAMLGLGRSFQDARLFPSMTVQECIAVALERHARTRDPIAAALASPATWISEIEVSQQVDALIETMHLNAFANKFVYELSTGSRRIVDLACAVAHDPRVLLLDEPSSGIAQRETEALAPLLVEMREKIGASFLIVEHDMPLITSVSDRLVALNLGAVITEGPPEEVLRHELVVEAYLGDREEITQRSGTAKKRKKARRPRSVSKQGT